MRVLAIADSRAKEELMQGTVDSNLSVQWIADPAEIKQSSGYDVCIDFLFENTPERVQLLKQLKASLIIINSVIATLEHINADFVRFNGWPGFLKRSIAEASCRHDALKEKAENFFNAIGKKTEWVPDIPGFITARVVATIINEAYFALEEGVSSKEEIDTAMKLGTNYPYGPFEWSGVIGTGRVHALLTTLSKQQKRYNPAALFTKEANV